MDMQSINMCENKKIISWNVNGIRAAEKKGLIDFIKTVSPDVIGLQETKASVDQLSDALVNIDGYSSYWHSAQKKGYSGVCTYTKLKPLNVTYGIGISEYDSEGRVITLEFEDFYFINCYFPNAQHELKRIDYKIGFNDAMMDYLKTLDSGKAILVCGDFNVAHKEIDLKNPKANVNNPGFSEREREWADKFVSSSFVDTFRMFNKEPEQYSWWSYRFRAREKNIGWRIDYFFTDEENKSRIKDAFIMKDVMGSDHCPVGVIFL